MINNYSKKYTDQRWLAAHNAWNTNQWPDFNNQSKTITELLDYGVRGFALDIYGDDELSLHLQHGHDNPATSIKWSIILKEITDWMQLPENKDEVVSLFFESYLKGPVHLRGNALGHLSKTLEAFDFYRSGKSKQLYSLNKKTLRQLVDGDSKRGIKPHRLFAFIEKQPDEGVQDLFPEMSEVFGENVYGDDSLNKNTWVNLREGSKFTHDLTFMNHFGNGPKGSEWSRNDTDLLEEHANAFIYAFNGRYPNFISLDRINWDPADKDTGPIVAVRNLQMNRDVRVTSFNWEKSNGYEEYDYYMDQDSKLIGFTVETARSKGITKIHPLVQRHNKIVGNHPGNDDPEHFQAVKEVQVINVGGHGIVNLRCRLEGNKEWEEWLVKEFEKDTDVPDADKKVHTAGNRTITGVCSRTADKYGVTDFAIAFL